jgi:hypothetical protein
MAMTDQPEQEAYERRMLDLCSLLALHALIIDTDPESRALSIQERVEVAGKYAETWAASRGHVGKGGG